MDIQKIELLIKKVNQVIKLIQKLKDNEKMYVEEISLLKENNLKLQKEIVNLKFEKEKLLQELNKNENYYKELEEKIIEILKYLPEEKPDEQDKEIIKNNTVDNKKDNNKENEVKNKNEIEINEEEILKKFIESDAKNIDKFLFGSKDNSNIENLDKTKKDTKSEADEISIFDNKKDFQIENKDNNNEKDKKGKIEFEDNFENNLIDDIEKDEINFGYFDSSSDNRNYEKKNQEEELPKGVY